MSKSVLVACTSNDAMIASVLVNLDGLKPFIRKWVQFSLEGLFSRDPAALPCFQVSFFSRCFQATGEEIDDGFGGDEYQFGNFDIAGLEPARVDGQDARIDMQMVNLTERGLYFSFGLKHGEAPDIETVSLPISALIEEIGWQNLFDQAAPGAGRVG